MKKYCTCFLLVLIAAKGISQKAVTLPNGWKLSPAGKSLSLGDLPLNIAVSKSKKLMAVTNNGQSTQSLQLIDVQTEKVTDSIAIAKSWLGLQFSSDEKYLYAGGGNDNRILKYAVINKKLRLTDSIILGAKWPAAISPAGIAIDDDRHLLYVVTKDNNALYIIDLLTKKITQQIKLDAEAYTCLLSPDKKTLYISCWGCDKLIFFNTTKRTLSIILMLVITRMICASPKTGNTFLLPTPTIIRLVWWMQKKQWLLKHLPLPFLRMPLREVRPMLLH